MTSSSELDSLRPKEQTRRRSKRVRVAVPIILSGKDIAGDEFRESTRTETINKHGAKIITTQKVGLGGIVTIENRILGLAADATVVRVGERPSAADPADIGVQLVRAGNVWGVIFPPEDWETGTSLVVEGEETLQPTAPTAETSSAPGSSPRPLPYARSPQPLTSGTPRVPAASLGRHQEPMEVITAGVLEKITQQLDEAVDVRVRDYTEKLVQFTNQFTLRVQADFQEAADRTEAQMVVLIRQKLGPLADRVQASRTALESLLARCEALEKDTRSLVEEAGVEIREGGRKALESALQELTTALHWETEGASAGVEAERQARFRAAISEKVGAALVEADAQFAALMKDRLLKSHAEVRLQHEQLVDAVKEQLNQIAVSGTTSLAARFETMALEMVPSAQQEMEKSLQSSVGKVVVRTTQSLQEQAQVLTRDALVSLQQAVQGLQGRIQEENRNLRQSSEQEMSQTAEAFNRNLAQRVEMALASVQSAAEQGSSKLRAAQLESESKLRAGIAECQEQLVRRSDTTLEGFRAGLENLAREMQEKAAPLFAQRLGSVTDELAEASEAKVRRRIVDEVDSTGGILSKEVNRRLSVLADEFSAGSAKELRARLQSQAEGQVHTVMHAASERFAAHLQKLTKEAGITLEKESGKELQKVAHTLLQSSSETLRKEVHQSAKKLQDDLKGFHARLSHQARKQLLALVRSTIEALNREAVKGLTEFRARLGRMGHESQEENRRELEANFREAREQHGAALLVYLQGQGEQSRESAGLQIRTTAEQVVANAVQVLDRQVEKSTRTLAEVEEQARVGLENQGQRIEAEAKNSVRDHQRQLEQSTRAELDRFRRETAVLLEEVVLRLQESVRSFQKAAADEVRGELQKASDNLLEVSAAEMRRQTERTLEFITERLKEKHEEMVNDAADIFRRRIAEIFAVLQEGVKKTAELPGPERAEKQG